MVSIEHDACTGCLACLDVCPDFVMERISDSSNGKKVSVVHPDHCCSCGHCIAVCAADAIRHDLLKRDDFVPVPELTVSPEEMKDLIISRRSIRKYKKKPVPDDMLEQLLASGDHAGTGGNIQSEEYVVVRNKDLLSELEQVVIDILWNTGFKHLKEKGIVTRIAGKKFGPVLIEQYKGYHHRFKNRIESGKTEGMIFRGAPAIIISHGIRANSLAYTNSAIALRNIELIAHTMGIGTCWAGFLMAAAEKKPKTINGLVGIDVSRLISGALMVGYPVHQYTYMPIRKKRNTRWL